MILASQAAVVAEDTIFGQLEVARGIIPLGGGGHRLPALGKLGTQWVLTADTFDAAQALQIGLVSEVVPTGTQLERAVQIAEKIASNAPLAVQAALANSRAAERAAATPPRRTSAPRARRCSTSADAMEAVAAMTEKRAPRFDGA